LAEQLDRYKRGLLHRGVCAVIKNPAMLVLLTLCAFPVSACDLKVSGAWIREAPPGLTTVAGYAVLTNDGNRPLQIVHIHSTQVTAVQMHETVIQQGVASMHTLDKLQLAPHQTVAFAPGGKHFMLMGATVSLKNRDSILLKFQDQHGCTVQSTFVVRNVSE
jgi:copper(I)-binding protein